MSHTVIMGCQWGDEGKGKVVDLLSEKADFVVRFQGGNNAGHTLVVNGHQTVLHLIPSGILHPGKICVIGNGVVFDPMTFFDEIDSLDEAGVFHQSPEQSIKVSFRAQIILPIHKKLDQLREQRLNNTSGKIGTTVRGIGPAYEDKASRRGIRAADLLETKTLKHKLQLILEEKNILFENLYGEKPFELITLYDQCARLGEELAPHLCDTQELLYQAHQKGQKILFEGAQGTLLDIDHGTYPFVTSSNASIGGAMTGTGIPAHWLENSIGITKCYTTRVGAGPFPTEMQDEEEELSDHLRKIGKEFGATTGRARRIGWLDLVALKYAAQVNGLTGIALMKLDVLNHLKKIRVCTDYQLNGKKTRQFPSTCENLTSLEPIYETHDGWDDLPRKIEKIQDFPKNLLHFIERIEDYLGIPVVMISYGQERNATWVHSQYF